MTWSNTHWTKHYDDVLQLKNLLPAGTIPLTVRCNCLSAECDHDHVLVGSSEEAVEWNINRFLEHDKTPSFESKSKIPNESCHQEPEDNIVSAIDHLVFWHFIRADYLYNHSNQELDLRKEPWLSPEGYFYLVVRIFLIPEDLEGLRSMVLVNNPKFRGDEANIKKCRNLLKQYIYPALNTNYSENIARDNQITKYLSLNLTKIFNDLESPTLDENVLNDVPIYQRHILEDLRNTDKPTGLVTPLYKHQKRSIWKMLGRELIDRVAPSPCLKAFIAADGSRKNYYLDVDGNVFSDPNYYHEPRGGILCEDMGVGKTLVCLALVSLTRGQFALPEPLTTNEVISQTITKGSESSTGIRSLLELCCHKINTSKRINLETDDQVPPHVKKLLKIYQPYYYATPCAYEKRTRRQSYNIQPESTKIYVSLATLIVVPDALYNQWINEIDKHLFRGYLRILYADKTTVLPPADKLAYDYDLVLMTRNRFASEGDYGSCSCFVRAPTSLTSHTNSCGLRKPESILLNIHWRRLAFDEGHSFGAISKTTSFSEKLRAESRWLITGTPTRNLVGYDFLGTNENGDEALSPSKSSAQLYSDRRDLASLKKMIINFLRMEPFFYNEKYWTNHVEKSFLDYDNHLIQQIMQTLTVRHSPGDLELTPESLPPIRRNLVILDLPNSPIALLSYNVLIALFVINTVTSLKDGNSDTRDWLFHPDKASSLTQLIQNLSAAHFYYASKEMESDAMFAIENLTTKVNFNEYPEHEQNLLNQCLKHLCAAIDNSCWRTCMRSESMPYQVGRFSYSLYRGIVQNASIHSYQMGILGSLNHEVYVAGDSIENMRSILDKILREHYWVESDSLNKSFLNEILNSVREKIEHEERKKNSRKRRRSAIDVESSSMKQVVEKDKRKSQRKSLSNVSAGSGTKRNGFQDDTNELRKLPPGSPLAISVIQKSFSPKINYIINQVLKHPDEKFLIFAPPGKRNEAYYINEALTIFQIKTCYYVTGEGMDITMRSQYLNDFQQKEEYQVMIMNVNIASHGLNVTAASRVIFVEPCWHADVQAQAEKRAHRIGQTRPVTVETLAMKDSFELSALERRKNLQNSGSKESSNIESDNHLRKILQEARFIDYQGDPKNDLIERYCKLFPNTFIQVYGGAESNNEHRQIHFNA